MRAELLEAVARGAGTVLNLGAGLDTRPYRLALPATLRCVEIDMPKIVAHKQELLQGERPICELQRIAADLSDAATRRTLLERVADVDHDVVVLTEGVVGYLSEAQVAELADDLRVQAHCRAWIVDTARRF